MRLRKTTKGKKKPRLKTNPNSAARGGGAGRRGVPRGVEPAPPPRAPEFGVFLLNRKFSKYAMGLKPEDVVKLQPHDDRSRAHAAVQFLVESRTWLVLMECAWAKQKHKM